MWKPNYITKVQQMILKCVLKGCSEKTSVRIFFLMRLLPERPVLLHLLFAGCWFHQMGRVVHDNRLKDDHVFPFIPEPA